MILQARQGEVDENLSRDMTVRLMSFLGLAWVLGVVSFGAVIVNNSTECRISRQYLTQVSTVSTSIAVNTPWLFVKRDTVNRPVKAMKFTHWFSICGLPIR